MKTKRITSALLVVLALSCLGWGNPGVSLVEEGNRLYREGDWEGALAKYNEALLELPEAREILYNIGGVHYRQGDLEKAAALYKSILESPDPALATRAAYNMGNTLFQGEEYSAAAEAFKAALKIDPGDEDASYNYELARKMIQQQQQEKEQEQKPEQQEEQEKEQQQQEEQEKEKDQDQEKEQKQEGSPPPSPAPQASPQEEQPAPPTEEKEMDPEDLKRLLNAMLSEEEEQRDEVREKLQGEPQETWKDW